MLTNVLMEEMEEWFNSTERKVPEAEDPLYTNTTVDCSEDFFMIEVSRSYLIRLSGVKSKELIQ
jgi:hypothetical protein